MNRDRPLILVRLFPPKQQKKPPEKTEEAFDLHCTTRPRSFKSYAPLPPKRKATEGMPLDLSDKILSLSYEDLDDKADKLELTLDNWDLSEFDNSWWKKGGILEISWGFVGNMCPARRVVIQKISGNQVMKVEAHGLEMLMHKAKTLKVYKGKTLYEIAKEKADKYADVLKQQKGADEAREKSAKELESSFPEFYRNLATRYNLDPNPENKRHFYDFKSLHADVLAGRTKLPATNSVNALPQKYNRGAPSMWIRDQEGTLINAKTGAPVTDAEVEKVADTSTAAQYDVGRMGGEDEDSGVSISHDARKVKIAFASQSAQTDAQFVDKLARKHGYRFYIDHTGFRLVPVGSVYKQTPAKTLTWFHGDGEWVSFSYENDGVEKSKTVKEKGINPLTKAEFEQEGSNDKTRRPGLGARVNEVQINQTTGVHKISERTAPPAVVTEKEKKEPGFLDKLKQWGKKASDATDFGAGGGQKDEEHDVAPATKGNPAEVKSKVDGKYKKRQHAAHELTGTVLGDPQFKAKTLIQVEGLGRRLSGKWEVRSVEHRVDSNGYMCRFKAQRDGDNGFGEKGEKDSKASLNKKEAPKKDVNGEQSNTRLHVDQTTGQHRVTTKNPQGTQK